FQACWEQKAHSMSSSLSAPAQRLEDFIQAKHSATLPDCSYLPGIISSDLREALPSQVSKAIREALMLIGKKMPAYRSNEAVLVGVESRTSSPVRIPRDKDTLQHPVLQNLYPCGEGAGYAGGIVSAALDGMRVAQMSIINL
ncbi:MAG: FAD-binding protein, partial [Bacteroidetes bacterium]|nr:FAD-binding protein [Bacteroidota bacterium]